ncbi:unnamed protein product [Larinioides sclopetarius]|uniref:Uncharacterized protein n=1 Tax=Larinioides sclopetarius TaxID=280406 RepID=A0AAV2A8F6_9ARAC
MTRLIRERKIDLLKTKDQYMLYMRRFDSK